MNDTAPRTMITSHSLASSTNFATYAGLFHRSLIALMLWIFLGVSSLGQNNKCGTSPVPAPHLLHWGRAMFQFGVGTIPISGAILSWGGPSQLWVFEGVTFLRHVCQGGSIWVTDGGCHVLSDYLWGNFSFLWSKTRPGKFFTWLGPARARSKKLARSNPMK